MIYDNLNFFDYIIKTSFYPSIKIEDILHLFHMQQSKMQIIMFMQRKVIIKIAYIMIALVTLPIVLLVLLLNCIEAKI